MENLTVFRCILSIRSSAESLSNKLKGFVNVWYISMNIDTFYWVSPESSRMNTNLPSMQAFMMNIWRVLTWWNMHDVNTEMSTRVNQPQQRRTSITWKCTIIINNQTLGLAYIQGQILFMDNDPYLRLIMMMLYDNASYT